MKVYAKAYKTYEGARKRMLHERACSPIKSCVWNISNMPNGYHVTRTPRAEFDRTMAVNIAKIALEIE